MKLGKLIQAGGLALALAAGTLASGCDDDDPATGKDGSASDAGTTDTGIASDAGKTDVTAPAPDAGAPDAAPADGGDDAGSDGGTD